MNSELVFIGLLAGVIGLVWVLMLSLWEGRPRKTRDHDPGGSSITEIGRGGDTARSA